MHFDAYLISKEFSQYRVEEVKQWPLAKLLVFKTFLSKFYELMTPTNKSKEWAFHFK